MAGTVTIDFEPYKVAVYDWLFEAINSGLVDGGSDTIPIIRSEDNGARPDQLFVEYKFLVSGVKIGMADEIRNIPDTEFFKVIGQRSVTVSINVIGENSASCMAQIQQSLSLPTICEQLRAAGMAVRSDESFQDASVLQETMFEDRSVFDVVFGINIEQQVDLGRIEKVKLLGFGEEVELSKYSGDIADCPTVVGNTGVLGFPDGKTTKTLEYAAIAALSNIVDSDPILAPIGIIRKTDKSFQGAWTGSLPGSNYKLEYIARLHDLASSALRVGSAGVLPNETVIEAKFEKLDTTDYTVVPTLVNLVDDAPVLVPIILVEKTDQSFKVRIPGPVDNKNYQLDYIVKRNDTDSINGFSWRSGSEDLTSGTKTVTVTIPTALADTDYSVVPVLVNETDSDPQIVPLAVTGKTVNSFSVNWAAPLDSENYKMQYIIREKDVVTVIPPPTVFARSFSMAGVAEYIRSDQDWATLLGAGTLLSGQVWFYPRALFTAFTENVIHTDPDTGPDGPHIFLDGSNELRHTINAFNNSNTPKSAAPIANAWNHLGFSWDPNVGVNGQQLLYLNGATISSGGNADTVINNLARFLSWGQGFSGTFNDWDVCEMAIWAAALSITELSVTLYNGGTPIDATTVQPGSLVKYHPGDTNDNPGIPGGILDHSPIGTNVSSGVGMNLANLSSNRP